MDGFLRDAADMQEGSGRLAVARRRPAAEQRRLGLGEGEARASVSWVAKRFATVALRKGIGM